MTNKKSYVAYRMTIISMSLVDSEGNFEFSYLKPLQIPHLRKYSS